MQLQYCMCLCAQTTNIPVHAYASEECFKVGVRGFPAREPAASNHMNGEGGSSGSRPGLEGNQQHMNRI